jgi:hypothetical protein
MRKHDIQPGVVYAYQEGKYQDPKPVMFLSTDLYTSQRRSELGPRFRKAASDATPHSGRYDNPSTGYLVAIMRDQFLKRVDRDEVAARMAKVTLADAQAAGWEHLDDLISFMLLVRLAPVLGPWDEVMAQRREADEEKARRQAAIAAEAKALDDRAAKVRLVLITNGISARFSTAARDLIVSLDDAEKLTALLAAKNGDDR